MASKKRQVYHEWETKAIMTDTGKLVTLNQIESLTNISYPNRRMLDEILIQLESVMKWEHIANAHISIKSWEYLNLYSDTVAMAIRISRDQIVALHDLFQWSRVEKIIQKNTNLYTQS